MSKKKLNIAICGCGRISKNHFEAILFYNKNFSLVGFCDTEKNKIKEISLKYNIPGFSDLNKMIKKIKIDILVICTPSGLHAKQCILASRNNIHVITEKPMALTYKNGVQMIAECRKNKTKLFVVKQNRFNKTLKLLKRAILEKRFGKIHFVQVNVFWTRPQSYYDQGNGWRGTKKMDGGAFMNQASHYIDLLTWLIGPVKKVQSFMSKFRKIEVEDTGTLNLEWLDGTLGSASVTMLTYPSNLEGSITIIGEKGTVKVGGVAVNEIQTWNFASKKSYDQNIKHINYKTKSVYGFGHKLYYKHIIDAFNGNAKNIIDGNEGIKSLELLVASYLSAKKNKTIELPLKNKLNV